MAQEKLEKLLQATANGDKTAFRAVYDATSAKLFAVAVRILKRADLAEDVMQDAYLKIWDAAPNYSPQLGSPVGWMVAITRNRAIDVLRKRVEVRIDDENESAEQADDAPDPYELTAQSHELKALLGCMKHLSAQQRQSLLMAYYYGYTHEEIAEQMKKPVGTIKSWIRRSLARVQECLGDG